MREEGVESVDANTYSRVIEPAVLISVLLPINAITCKRTVQ